MSGMATAPFNEPTTEPCVLARQQAKLVGISNADDLTNTELIEQLRMIDVNKLVDSGDGLRVCL